MAAESPPARQTPPAPAGQDDPQHRLAALRSYGVLDTPREAAFDDIASLVARLCDAPIAVVNLIDECRQWFKAEVGIGTREMALDASICAKVFLGKLPVVVNDLTQDERFACLPLVQGEPKLRFYAGAPLLTPDGHALGTLCVIDTRVRELTPLQLDTLVTLAAQVMAQLELRRAFAQSQARQQRQRLLISSIEWLVPGGDVQAAVTRVCAHLATELGLETFLQRRLEGATLPIAAAGGLPPAWRPEADRLSMSDALCAQAARENKPLVIDDAAVSEVPGAGLLSEISLRAYACHPLVSDGRLLGTLAFASRHPHRFGDAELDLLQAVTTMIAAALRREEALTERQRAEERLKVRTAQLETLLSAAPIGVAFFDREHRYTRINEVLAGINGIPVAQHIGRTVREVLPLAPDVDPVIDRIFETGEAVGNLEFQGETPLHAGATRHWLTGFYPVRDDAGVIEEVGVWVTEITAAKQAEATLLEADRRKDDFLATLAHELRNPLAPVLNATQLIAMKDAADPQLRWARELIERQVRHLTRLVDDLLDVSRISRDKIDLKCERIDLAGVLATAVDTSRSLVEQQGHELRVDPPAEPVWVMGDSVRLVQVFMNLLTNAAKYTDPGGRIELSAETRDAEVAVRVRDNGIGVSAEQLPHVFDMFYQVDSALNRTQGGLGIGLALVKRLVDMHGGTVTAASAGRGRGCTLEVVLPRTFEPADGWITPLKAASSTVPRRRVLVADDNHDAAHALAILLDTLGHDVRVVHDGLAAIDEARRSLPEVALLDLGMPRADGYEAARRIRELAGGSEVLLVALTGWGQDEDRRRTRGAGFDRHLVKPAEVDVLMALLAAQPPG